MEAPVKFRSPLLEKPVGFDVGARVFRGLNIIEVMLAMTLASLSLDSIPSDVILVCLSSMLAIQVLFLTPSLVRIGKARAVKDLDRESLKGKAREYYDELQKEVRTFKSLPPRSLHALYVLMELVKVILLPMYAFQNLSDASGAFSCTNRGG
mmetsp:Transcript_9983/g.19174  ORF Transcript_9983/g.19174 Transcript_9983/m.19174 type:complete len:152 (+) Transcript_9983:283-738(+)